MADTVDSADTADTADTVDSADTILDMEDMVDSADTVDMADTVDSADIILMMTLALTTCLEATEDTEVFTLKLRMVKAMSALTPQMTTTNTQSQIT
jgi:hypothetical protein